MDSATVLTRPPWTNSKQRNPNTFRYAHAFSFLYALLIICLIAGKTGYVQWLSYLFVMLIRGKGEGTYATVYKVKSNLSTLSHDLLTL